MQRSQLCDFEHSAKHPGFGSRLLNLARKYRTIKKYLVELQLSILHRSYAYVINNNSSTVTLLLLVVKESKVWLLKALEKHPTQSLSRIVLSLGAAKDFMSLPRWWLELGTARAVVAKAGVPIPADFPGVARLRALWQLDFHTSQAGL